MKQCSNGHIYDESIHAVCPYCSNANVGVRPLGDSSMMGGMQPQFGAPAFPATEAVNSPAPAFPATEPVNAPSFPKTEPVNTPKVKKEMSATVALNVTDDGVNPVRGWLVAVEGEKCGQSFVIHSEKNTIGRGAGFDIDLSFDRAVSKDGDAMIAYDARNKKFFLSPASGKNNVYHNNDLLLMPVEIKDYDTLEIGSTKLVFRSFCNSEFTY